MKRIIVAAMFCVALVGCGKKERSQEQKERDVEIGMQVIAKKFVLGSLKDPDSATFRNQNGPCGEVNSKNSFGGMTGFQRFIAASEKLVIFERDSGISESDFQNLWVGTCGYRPK